MKSALGWLLSTVVLGSLVSSLGCTSTPRPPLVTEVKPNLPTQPPPVTPYRITENDELRITIYKRSDLSTLFDLTAVGVWPDGKILVPLVGEVRAAGLTPDQLRDEITTRLEEFLVNPVVNIGVKATKPKIYVLGEVKTPGVYRIDRDTTAIEALVLAGGMTRDADTSLILLLRTTETDRPAPTLAAVSFEELFMRADVRQNVVLQGGDILYVPPDYIARANRVFQHIATVVAPFAQTFGVITQVLILSNTLK